MNTFNDKPLFILAGNAPYENRGCEAIVRGTVEILRKYYDDPEILVLSRFNHDRQYRKQIEYEHNSAIKHGRVITPIKRFRKEWFIYNVRKRLQSSFNMVDCFATWEKELSQCRVVLSVGGDNYSLDYGIPKLFTDIDDYVLKRNKPMIIWGASVGPFSAQPNYEKKMIKHLKTITAIFARETKTIEYLDKHGIRDSVYRVADPAFVMPATAPGEDKFDIEVMNGSLGLNLSPLMARYTRKGSLTEWMTQAADIVTAVATRFKQPVYLIPHVTTPSSNDYLFLKGVLKMIPKEVINNITLIPDTLDAQEIKWVIQQMEVFAGARTHSTIAALSSAVPTLSFAYSIKAQGINRDIYGHTDFCINLNDLVPGVVVERIEHLLEKKKSIHMQLMATLPEIQGFSFKAGEILKRLIGGR